ncbi:MAG: hypothetical protein ACI9TK_000094 [Flavobacteriaceae bacterium]|jgi:hypothetical protein|tara:strand:+ start:379 stop:885 length:507 start_codon:yes stop_codon:yes gene_type:complete
MYLLLFYFLINVSPDLFTDIETHKFYVSTTEIEYKREIKMFQIKSQLFIDDLELLLQQEEKSLRLDPDSNTQLSDSLLKTHLKKELQFIIDGEPQEITYLGNEYKNDIVVCYLELYIDELPRALEIKNRMFFDLFDTQQNIIHFKSEVRRKSFLLRPEAPTLVIDLTK